MLANRQPFTVLVILALGTFGIGSPVAAQRVQWRHQDGGNGHYYQAFSSPTAITWSAANAAAQAAGGYLATITSAAENAFVFSLVNDPKYWSVGDVNAEGPYLGGLQAFRGAPWQWVTGEPWVYTNWAPGQPDSPDTEFYLQFWGQGSTNRTPQWNNITGVDPFTRGYVVEWDKLPAADLVMTSFDYRVVEDHSGEVNGPIPVNGNLAISGMIVNQGQGDSEQFSVRVYVSLDDHIDPSEDVPIGDVIIIRPLKAGDRQQLNAVVHMPIHYLHGYGYVSDEPRFTPDNYHGKVYIGVVIDVNNEVEEGEVGESNNSNQGDGVDMRSNKLYDPVMRPPFLEREVRAPDGGILSFSSRLLAELFLVQQGFSRPINVFIGTDPWSKPLTEPPIRSWFNNRDMPAAAFRLQGGIGMAGPRDYRIGVQGDFNWVFVSGPRGGWIMQPIAGEPSPRWAITLVGGLEWLEYVKDYHVGPLFGPGDRF